MIPEGEPHYVTNQNKGNFISFLEYLVRFELVRLGKKLFLIVESGPHYCDLSV